jgi:hypothetical protein
MVLNKVLAIGTVYWQLYCATQGILQITQAGFVKHSLEQYSMQDAKPRAIPTDTNLKFSRKNETKCNEHEKEHYHEYMGIIG